LPRPFIKSKLVFVDAKDVFKLGGGEVGALEFGGHF
jgi:hypothetical protein